MGSHGHRGANYTGLALLICVAAAWSGLSFWLSAGGHVPSGPSPFGDEHYRIQAWLMVPTLLIAALVFAYVSWARLGRGNVAFREWASGATRVYAIAIGAGWVLPDFVALGVGAYDGIRVIAPFLPLLSTALALVFGARFVRSQMEHGVSKTLRNLLLAWVLQAIVLMTVIR